MTVAEPLRALTEAAREACPPRAWSRGVILAREDAVQGREAKDDEVVLEVRVPERPVPQTVVLYLETAEWDCDCEARVDACAHVAAAVIALGAARAAGRALPVRRVAGPTLRYRFFRDAGRLALERLLVDPSGATARLTVSTARHTSVRSGPRLDVGEADLELEPFFREGLTHVTLLEQSARLVALLARVTEPGEVWLDDRRVAVDAARLLPRARVTGDGRRFTVRLLPDPALEEVLADGLALAGGALRPLGEVGLAGARWEKLPTERAVGPEGVAELVAETLPLLSARFPVEVATPHLPALGGALAPRLDLGVRYLEDGVEVRPTLVYGDPPRLRVEEGGRAVHLGGAVPGRDLAAERALVDRLRDATNLAAGRPVKVRAAEAGAFLERLRAFAEDLGGAASELALPRLEPRVALEGGRLELDFETAGAGEGGGRRAADAGQVLRAFAAGEALVPLLGGGWAELPRDWLARHGAALGRLLDARDAAGRVPPACLPELGRLAAELDQPPLPELERLRPLLAGFEGLPEATLPGDLSASLRPYQRRGVDWLCFLRDAGLGALLADDMGLGKTLQAIAALSGRALVVCPTSVLPNWQAELARFRPGLSVRVHHGAGRSLDPAADVTLTTYALLRGDQALLAGVRWDTVVLDEAQAIKNPESQTARAAHALDAGFRVALTGTPVENRLEELWSQLHFSCRGLLGGRAAFVEEVARPVAAGDAEAARRLRERIRPFVLRRRKSEVARDLPPRIETTLFAELDVEERAVYDALRLATRDEVVRKLREGAGVMAALEALLRLRQAACHRGLVPGQDAATSAKVELLLETLTQAVGEGHKALVFSQWTSLLDRVEPHLAAAGLAFARLDGATADRGAVVAAFQAEGGPPVMLLSLKAGGTGLNLTAADHVFLLDPWWNPAVEDQAADRAHRLGQERPVIIHRLVARETVEERILALQARKRAVAAAALEGAGAATALTRDDLLALLD